MTNTYIKPTIKVCKVKADHHLLQGSIDPNKATEPAGAKEYSFDFFYEEEEQPRTSDDDDSWEEEEEDF